MSPTFGQILRANLDVVLLVAVALLATSLGVVRTQALYENSLLVHPEWVSTKATLHRGVMGALPFVSGQQALARNSLNLGAATPWTSRSSSSDSASSRTAISTCSTTTAQTASPACG